MSVENSRVEAILNRTDVEVVSFDVFDTAVVRPFVNPKHLFHFLTPTVRKLAGDYALDFPKLRTIAESNLRSRLDSAKLDRDPTIEEIYDEICLARPNLSTIVRDLIDIEINTEIDLCRRNERIYQIFQLAVSLDKRIVFASDTYLNRFAIEAILNRAGYTSKEHVFVSSALSASKKHGTLFPIMQQKLGVPYDGILHFGDNVVADCNMPKQLGIKVMHFKKNVDEVTGGNAPGRVWPRGELPLAESIRVAQCAHKLNKNNFDRRTPASLFGGDMHALGFALLGPFLLELAIWLLETARKNGCSTLVFLSRDGYLPLKAVEIIAEGAIPLKYAHISRKALFPFRALREPNLEWLFEVPYDAELTVEKFLGERLGENIWTSLISSSSRLHSLRHASVLGNEDALCELLNDDDETLKKELILRAANARTYYQRVFTDAERSLVFDVGRKGTFQSFFADELGQAVFGTYVVTHSSILQRFGRNDHAVFYNPNVDAVRSKKLDTIFFEALFSSTSGSSIGFTEFGEPIVDESKLSSEAATAIEQGQAGALDYVRDTYSTFGTRISEFQTDISYFDEMFDALWDNELDSSLLGKIRHEDNLTASEIKSLETIYFRRRLTPFDNSYPTILIYCPAFTRIKGGVERVASYIAHALSRKKFNVIIATAGDLRKKPEPVYPVDANVKVYHVDPRNPETFRAVLKNCSVRAALILASGSFLRGLASALQKERIPFVLGERAAPSGAFKTYWKGFNKSDYMDTYRKAQLISVQLPSFRKWFPADMREKIVCIPNPVQQSPCPNHEERNDWIVCVARLFLEQKQQDVLVSAFASLASRYPTFSLMLYGHDQGGKDIIQKLSRDLGVEDRVRIMGETSDVYPILEKAKVFVLPSVFEGFPNALAEALASGVPSVGFLECAGVNELIKNDWNGVLVPGTRDAASLASGIEMILSDPEKWKTLSENARTITSDYAMNSCVAQWVNLTKRLITTTAQASGKKTTSAKTTPTRTQIETVSSDIEAYARYSKAAKVWFRSIQEGVTAMVSSKKRHSGDSV